MTTPADSSARSYLLDSHAFLWLAGGDPRLPARVRAIALDETNRLVLSVASIWELAIQSGLGRLRLTIPLSRLIESQRLALGLRLLAISSDHAMAVEDLQSHHRDPFDRLLVAQAKAEKLVLLSRDALLDPYGVERVWA